MIDVLQLTKPLAEPREHADSADYAIRPFAGSADVPPWLTLREAAFARQPVGVRQWTPADFAAEFLDRWWWRPERMWLAEVAEASIASTLATIPPPAPTRLVGSVTLAMRGDAGDARPVVHWLMVHPAWRRHGIAQALMARLETRAWKLGYRQVWLETHAQWQAAAALYRKLGYSPAKTID